MRRRQLVLIFGLCAILAVQENVAVRKLATMSSYYSEVNYKSGPASLAVDGNTSTFWRSCVHTAGNNKDWWQVDLGRKYTVSQITIYHRELDPDQRMGGLWVYVDDTICYKFPDSNKMGDELKEKYDITCDQPIRGKIVRFSKDGIVHNNRSSYINFCEVQVWVCKPGLYGEKCDKKCDSNCREGQCDNYSGACVTENVAMGKLATMSSYYSEANYRTGPASLAVDGNTSTFWRSCVHTAGNNKDWWQVDLGRKYTVSQITIYHRELASPMRDSTTEERTADSQSGSSHYSKGDMGGLAVAMIIIGVLLGAVGLVVYRRFWGRFCSSNNDSMSIPFPQFGPADASQI
ncbi:hypothetical protein ACOMHN_028100 [Nucella lapillus]